MNSEWVSLVRLYFSRAASSAVDHALKPNPDTGTIRNLPIIDLMGSNLYETTHTTSFTANQRVLQTCILYAAEDIQILFDSDPVSRPRTKTPSCYFLSSFKVIRIFTIFNRAKFTC